MNTLTKTLVSLVLFSLSVSLYAQQDSEELSADCACCTKAHGDFDFWLGTWTVRSNNGVVVGVNTISKLEENCLIQEKWVGEAGSTGMSINYYNPEDGKWHQTW